MDKLIKVGIIGTGTVGGGTIKVLAQNLEVIDKRATNIEISMVCTRELEAAKEMLADLNVTTATITGDFNEILNNPEIDIVVELIGGIHPAFEIAQGAMKAGKSVVTANKDLVASHGATLFALAEEMQVDFLFEASVAGGIPVLKALKDSLAANNIVEIMGIVNGTTNFILSEMSETGADLAPMLQKAQELGYAESDPTNDVEGFDAARKMAILASIAYNSNITEDMVSVEGITKITKFDIAYADQLGYVIKLVGTAKADLENKDLIEVCVHPLWIKKNHPLASVNDVFNAVFITGDALGPSMFYGAGAGSLPTASAVVGDIITAAKKIVNDAKGVSGIRFFENKKVKPMAECEAKFYIRMMVCDKPLVLAQIADVFGNNEVSLDSILQKRVMDSGLAEIVMITHTTKEKNVQEALATLKKLDCVDCIDSLIRVYGN